MWWVHIRSLFTAHCHLCQLLEPKNPNLVRWEEAWMELKHSLLLAGTSVSRANVAPKWLRVCGRGGFAPSSSESVQWMVAFTSVGWGPVQAATTAWPFAGISVSSHSISETKGKVFKLDLKNKRMPNVTALQLPAAKSCWLWLFFYKWARGHRPHEL